MKKRSVVLAGVLSSAALIVGFPSKAEANDTQCMGALIGTFDNVVVPAGETCILTDSTVLGNVKALEDSRLLISDSNVRGNVEGDKADIVQIFFTTVRESISIKEGGPAEAPAPAFNVCVGPSGTTPCEVLLAAATVEEGGIQIEKMTGDVLVDRAILPGNLKVEENFIAGLLLIQNSSVDQNLQVFKNMGLGNKFVQVNTVGDNLQCFENAPPFLGRFNTAGKAEGQCAPPAVP
jgi:hypothetical protein